MCVKATALHIKKCTSVNGYSTLQDLTKNALNDCIYTLHYYKYM